MGSLGPGQWLMVILVMLLFSEPFLRAQDAQAGDLTTITTEGFASITVENGDVDSTCATGTDYRSRFASDEQRAEWNLGAKLALKIAQEDTIESDPLLTQYLNNLEHKLVSASGLSGCFVVQLVADKEVNAYSLPGGFIYLTTGLAMSADREGELVGALAHETGHVMARHFSRIEHKRRLGHDVMLAGGPAGYMIARILGPIFMRKLMRNAEFEADRLSVKYQYASGYDPNEFIRLLRDIDEQDGPSNSLFSQLFDTHPSIASRLHRLNTVGAGSLAVHMNQTTNDADFRAFKLQLSFHYARP